MKIQISRFGLKELDLHLNYQIQNHYKYQCNCLDFIIAYRYMHQCVNVNIFNFATFGLIFVKFRQTVEVMNWECYSIFLEVFAHFFDRAPAGANIWHQNRPRKIPDLVYSNVLWPPA